MEEMRMGEGLTFRRRPRLGVAPPQLDGRPGNRTSSRGRRGPARGNDGTDDTADPGTVRIELAVQQTALGCIRHWLLPLAAVLILPRAG